MANDEINPYRSPETVFIARRVPASKVLLRFVYFYPALVVSFIYIAWGLSSLALGRAPRPYRDYPDNVLISFFEYGAFLMILLVPIAIPGGMFVAFRYPFGNTARINATGRVRVMSLMFSLMLTFGAWTLIRLDPWRVVDWYMD